MSVTINPEEYGARRCERRNCRKPAVKDSRWCTGHAYVGEYYQEKPQLIDDVPEQMADAASLWERISRVFKPGS